MLSPTSGIAFTPIDPLQFVLTHIVLAQIGFKKTPISAIRGTPGEVIKTYTSGGFYETENKVEIDPNTNLPDWVVTQKTGEKMVIKDSKFHELYFHPPEETNKNIYYPAGGKRGLIQLDDNVSFKAPWGKEQYIKKGGYIVVVDKDNIYGIQKEEFDASYQMVENESGEKLIRDLLNLDK